ncbi:MAG TPA: hypothetical protein PLP42_08715 [Acidobacteriota bacterium]|nr:hypothetical protein [Acidobacteriota bacterium]
MDSHRTLKTNIKAITSLSVVPGIIAAIIIIITSGSLRREIAVIG